MTLRPLEARDWPRVAEIFAQGIASGMATFETRVPDWTEWDRNHLKVPRWVAIEDGDLVGWAALSPVSAREVYAGVAEVSVYVETSRRGRGWGRTLLGALIHASEQQGIWTLQAGVFPENRASVALHRSMGFREVGRRERIARLAGAWRDTLLMERRSRRVGVEALEGC